MYTVKIAESSKELTAKDRIKMKDTSNAVKLDAVLSGDEPLCITPVAYAILDIHNDKADDKDYQQFLVMDESGAKFVTGSQSFWNAFFEIWSEMEGEDEEWMLEIYKKDSKNYSGKKFITCSIV